MTNMLLEEIKLRKFIRKVIMLRKEKILQEQKKMMLEEQNLRKVIRHLLTEAEVDTDTEPVPYKSTAVNFVNTVFGTVLKPIKKGLRQLTDGGEERVSYRDHIIKDIGDLFKSLNSLAAVGAEGDEEAVVAEQIEVEIGDEANELEPDVEDPNEPKKKQSKEEEEVDEFEKFAIPGKDPTGAAVAMDTLGSSNIKDTIQKYHRMLGDDAKKKEFEEYFMYNLDLFMIKYERQLAAGQGQDPTFTDPIVPKPEDAVIREPAEEEEEAPAADTEAPAPADDELPPL